MDVGQAPLRRKFVRTQDKEEIQTSQPASSRYNILDNSEQSLEFEQSEDPVSDQATPPNDQKVIRVRDPKTGKNNQKNKSVQQQKSSSTGKCPKVSGRPS
ncbi:protein kinase [Sesbania bispinosa]|nr:protein kinase [Sesbania bispinosa]